MYIVLYNPYKILYILHNGMDLDMGLYIYTMD